MDPLNVFPDEVNLLVFSHLGIRDLATCSEVNSRWKALAEDDILWKGIAQQRIGKQIPEGENSKWFVKRFARAQIHSKAELIERITNFIDRFSGEQNAHLSCSFGSDLTNFKLDLKTNAGPYLKKEKWFLSRDVLGDGSLEHYIKSPSAYTIRKVGNKHIASYTKSIYRAEWKFPVLDCWHISDVETAITSVIHIKLDEKAKMQKLKRSALTSIAILATTLTLFFGVSLVAWHYSYPNKG